jgi:hypothetical protein
MELPIYQNMGNLINGSLIRRYPSKSMNDMMWESCTFDWETFGCEEVYHFNSIIITNFVQTFIPNCQSPNASLSTLALKSPNMILIWYLWTTRPNFLKKLRFTSSILASVGQ